MSDKHRSLAEAVATIEDGSVLALGGNTLHRAPAAAVHELVRQGRRGLELVKTAGAYDVDLLCGTGCASAVSAGFVGYENVFGLAPLYRRAVEGGRVEAREHACYTVIAGLRAAAQGVPFMPINALQGSDLPRARDFRTVRDPYSDREVVAVPAIVPDVALIHVHEADAEGNGRIVGSLFEDTLMVRAAKRVILTAERIVDGASFAEDPERTTIPGFLVDAVVEAPRGAWPTSCAGLYDYDEEYLGRLVAAAADEGALRRFVEEHVLGAPVAGRVAARDG
ncbi:MAG: CoA transferase subunit A [Chloroflexota bacterium]|nr:CoA transferase subunit A [Chloroflexota bacterium]